MPGKSGGGPNPALLPIFLMMSQNGKELENSLDELVSFIQSAKNTLEAMRNGLETFQAGMLKMAPPAWPGSPSPQKQSGPTAAPAKENEAGPSKAPAKEDTFILKPAAD